MKEYEAAVETPRLESAAQAHCNSIIQALHRQDSSPAT